MAGLAVFLSAQNSPKGEGFFMRDETHEPGGDPEPSCPTHRGLDPDTVARGVARHPEPPACMAMGPAGAFAGLCAPSILPAQALPLADASACRDTRQAPWSETLYGAVDLGTNNCRLLVARPTPRNFRVVDAFSRIVRLGEGLGSSGRLATTAMDRAVSALEICAGKMRARGVRRARVIATEACRAAENGADFCAMVEERTGLVLEVVDRRTEAGLAAGGCAPLVDPGSEGAVLFDIGGGSTEVVWLGRRSSGDSGPARGRIRAWVSLPVGVVTLAERHGGVHVTPDVFRAMRLEVAAMLDGVRQSWGMRPGGRIHLLGTSGTVTTVAGIYLGLERYDRGRVDGAWLSAGQIEGVVQRLLGMSFEDRVANPCIGAQRADLVLAGCAIMEAVRRVFPAERLRVADRGLREGMLVQLMRADGAWRQDSRQAGSRWERP